jgi:hypothetical protein
MTNSAGTEERGWLLSVSLNKTLQGAGCWVESSLAESGVLGMLVWSEGCCSMSDSRNVGENTVLVLTSSDETSLPMYWCEPFSTPVLWSQSGCGAEQSVATDDEGGSAMILVSATLRDGDVKGSRSFV